jgi:hypothetical protein
MPETMKTRIAQIFLFILMNPLCQAQKLPEGYILQYQQNFNDTKSLADFRVANPESWGIYKAGVNFYLQFARLPGHNLQPKLPQNIAVLNNHIFGDFVLEADVMPVPDTFGLGEICLFLGLKDQSKYYYIQLANRCDSLLHGIYVVKNSSAKRLTPADAQPVTWKEGKWLKIRLERNIVKRTIVLYAGDMKQPILQAKDYELVMGSVGFGSFAGAGQIDNIRIWAPTVISEE